MACATCTSNSERIEHSAETMDPAEKQRRTQDMSCRQCGLQGGPLCIMGGGRLISNRLLGASWPCTVCQDFEYLIMYL